MLSGIGPARYQVQIGSINSLHNSAILVQEHLERPSAHSVASCHSTRQVYYILNPPVSQSPWFAVKRSSRDGRPLGVDNIMRDRLPLRVAQSIDCLKAQRVVADGTCFQMTYRRTGCLPTVRPPCSKLNGVHKLRHQQRPFSSLPKRSIDMGRI